MRLNLKFFADLVLEFFSESIHRRELIHPFERPASVDQYAIGGIATRRALFGRQRRLAHGGPHAFNDVEIFTHMAASGNRPDNVGRIGDVDVVIDNHDELAAIGAGTSAGGDEQSLFRMTCVALFDGYDGKRSRLAAVYKPPYYFDLGNACLLQLIPKPGIADPRRQINCMR